MRKSSKGKRTLVQTGPNSWAVRRVIKGPDAEEIERRLLGKKPRTRQQRRKRPKDNQEGIREA